jgi:multiple sugar transport system permease protein
VWALLFLTPFAGMFVWFALYPLFYELSIGLRVDNFVELLKNPVYGKAIINTVIFVVVSVNLKMFLALILSGAMVAKSRIIRWASIVAIVPWMVPEVVALLSARWMLNSQSGLLNSLLGIVGVGPQPWLDTPGLALGSAIAMHIWKLTPFWALALLAVRLAIPTQLFEAAAIDGASRWQTFRDITWPQLTGVYLAGTVLASIWAVGDFNSVYLVTGGGPANTTQVLATLGVSYAFTQGNPSVGASVVLTALPVLVLALIFLIRRTVKRGVLL